MARNAETMSTERMWTVAELADRYQVTVKTLRNWRYLGVGPRPVKIGRHPFYPDSEVARWEANRRRGTLLDGPQVPALTRLGVQRGQVGRHPVHAARHRPAVRGGHGADRVADPVGDRLVGPALVPQH